MANYYTQFSLEVTDLTDDEVAWLKHVLRGEKDEPNPELAAILGDEMVWFETEFVEPAGLWIHSGESGSPDQAAEFLQEFLRKFRPDRVIGFGWADTCSKPRLDTFGGGAVVVSATDFSWVNTHEWLAEMLKNKE